MIWDIENGVYRPRRGLMKPPRKSFLPGMFPGGAMAGEVYEPASFSCDNPSGALALNSTTRGLSDTPTTQVCYSVWCKSVSGGSGTEFVQLACILSESSGQRFQSRAFVGGDIDTVAQATSFPLAWGETVTGGALEDQAWHHYFIRCDTTQGTADDRIRMYRDGSLLTDASTAASGGGSPNASEDTYSRYANQSVQISLAGGDGKLAFAELIYGTAAPTDVAFDNGGTWTRKPFTGSYGTGGFFLDGTDGFLDLVNGWDFSEVGATGISLDTDDLPPYTN